MIFIFLKSDGFQEKHANMRRNAHAQESVLFHVYIAYQKCIIISEQFETLKPSKVHVL